MSKKKKKKKREIKKLSKGQRVVQLMIEMGDHAKSPSELNKRLVRILKEHGGEQIYAKRSKHEQNGYYYSVTMPSGKANVKAIKEIENLVGEEHVFRSFEKGPLDDLCDKLFNG